MSCRRREYRRRLHCCYALNWGILKWPQLGDFGWPPGDVRKALADAGVRERLHNLGNDTLDISPAEFARFVREEIDTYQRVISTAGIKPQ
ncbi:MAG: hypothetical protein ACREB3_04185 [Burkholderiales bacterium]